MFLLKNRTRLIKILMTLLIKKMLKQKQLTFKNKLEKKKFKNKKKFY